jgi:hypothetical protein
MGCHTWFYKKIDGPSGEELKDTLLEKVNSELNFLNRLINDRGSIDQDLLECYPEWTPEYAQKNMGYWESLKSNIESNMSISEMSDLLCEMTYGEITDYIEDKGWFVSSDELPHDVFRKYGYPEDRLFSLEETLAYIRDPKNECVVYDHTEELLEKFWKEHPEGMINFG